MKKLFGLIFLSLLCFNFSIADENEELKLFQGYKERLFESALKEDLKQVEKICTNYKSEKEKIIFEDEYQEMRLDWLCEGGLSHIFNMITYEYNDKLLDESLSHIDVCNEYKKIPLDESQYDQMGINTHMGIMNYCETVELRASFKQDAKHNLIKDLDLEKLNFNFLSNKFYSLTIPENEITKKSSCHLNLKKEKRLNYLKIKKRCGVKSISYQEENPAGSNGEITSYELISDDDLTGSWIIVTDYFYADANEDGYMDLVIRFKNDGSYSMFSNTTTILVTSLNNNEYKNINYSEGAGKDSLANKSFEDYSILIEEGNDSVMLTYRYPSNFEPNNSTYSLEILDYGKFEFNRIAYINAKNNETPIFIQPSNLEIESDYKSLMQPKYQIDNVAYEFKEDAKKQTIKIKSTDNNLRIHNKIEEYFNNKSELSATILSGGVYAANKFLPVTNIEQLKDLFKNNPQTFCRLLSEKNISDKTNRELKSDLKSLLTDEIKKCEDKNIIINITSNKYLESNTLPSLICEKSSRTGASDDMLSFELSDKAEYKILKISNSEIKFNFGRGEYYILGNLDIETSKLGLMLFDDSNYKNLVGSKRYICDKEIEITQRIVENSEPDIAWKADDKFIIPECFDYVWLSGDKYETFFNEYIEKLDTHREDPRFQNFIVEIGTYLNREVPLNHSIDIDWSGYPSISLTKKLKGCFSDKPQTFVTFLETYYWKDGTSSIEETYISYEVLESYDLKIAKKLAPHIKQEFESIKKVSVKEWSGGSMGPKYHTATYGLITIDGEKVLLPLKNHIKY
jgi:hypothetical protein